MQGREFEDTRLGREDIGYGAARPYEYGPRMGPPRERRLRRRDDDRRPRQGEGPYHQRLQRRQRPDRWIQAEIEERLFNNTWIDADAVTVDVQGGTVTLIGMLPDTHEIQNAIRTARHTTGVRQIENRLEVRP